jgi:hypothetical protein
MAGKPKTSVVLTSAARELLSEAPIRYHLKDGRYLNCDSVEHNHDFLDLEVTAEDHQGRLFTSKISIPKLFVLYTVSAAPAGRRELGFKDEPSSPP